jgi:hypothetical protein
MIVQPLRPWQLAEATRQLGAGRRWISQKASSFTTNYHNSRLGARQLSQGRRISADASKFRRKTQKNEFFAAIQQICSYRIKSHNAV